MVEGTVVVLPALVVGAIFLFVAWRQRLPALTIAMGLAAVAHLAAVVGLTLFPLPVQREVIREGRMLDLASNNFFPMVNTVGDVAAGRLAAVLRLALGNVLALAPLGIYGPLLWRGLRTWQAVLVTGMGASVAIESAQLVISAIVGYTYRVADVDDVLFNVAGVVAGYAVYRLLARGRANVLSTSPDRRVLP